MSWEDLMRTKHFGDVYRPWADVIADIGDHIDNLIAHDPEFARFVRPIDQRDFYFVFGERLMLLCFSRGMQKHFPFRHGVEWSKVMSMTEAAFIGENPGCETTGVHLNPGQLKLVVEGAGFVHPLGFAFPHFFPTADAEPKDSVFKAVAATLVKEELRMYQEHLERQKPKDIFLSHKSVDKALVREVSATLRAAGLSPWFDEDRMKAGANLERSILAGFQTSCAAVFFVTPKFVDDAYLAAEVDYAIAQKRARGDRFAIITLQLAGDDGSVGTVPDLLRTYVWKAVSPIEVVRTILDALPIHCGDPVWRV